MSLEIQMDTQRAIRQEVSAVFGAFMQQMAQGNFQMIELGQIVRNSPILDYFQKQESNNRSVSHQKDCIKFDFIRNSFIR